MSRAPFLTGASAAGGAAGSAGGVTSPAKATISRPSALYAGEARIFGTHVARNASAAASPPGVPSMHGDSVPSLQRLGAM